MTTKTYRITGVFRQNRRKNPFKVDARALDENAAKNKIYKDLGSKHKLKRRDIFIENITEIEPKDSKSLVLQQLGGE